MKNDFSRPVRIIGARSGFLLQLFCHKNMIYSAVSCLEFRVKVVVIAFFSSQPHTPNISLRKKKKKWLRTSFILIVFQLSLFLSSLLFVISLSRKNALDMLERFVWRLSLMFHRTVRFLSLWIPNEEQQVMLVSWTCFLDLSGGNDNNKAGQQQFACLVSTIHTLFVFPDLPHTTICCCWSCWPYSCSSSIHTPKKKTTQACVNWQTVVAASRWPD